MSIWTRIANVFRRDQLRGEFDEEMQSHIDEAIANGLADRLGDLAAAIARARELAGIKEPLPIERFPEAGGLAARLGLGGVSTDILPAVMAHTLPAELSLWLHLAHSHRLHVMAWRAPMITASSWSGRC